MYRLSVVLVALTVACGSAGSPPPTQAPPAAALATAAPAATASTMPAPREAPPLLWNTFAHLLHPYSEIAVAELNGKVYVIGGYPSTRLVVDAVQVYDLASNTWQLTTPLPMPLHHTVAAGVNGKLYVIGGELPAPNGTASTVPGESPYTDVVLEYTPATATWTRKAPMPTARSAGAPVVLDGKIYVAGGRPPRGADFAVYDPALDRWTTLPNLPTQRNHLAAGVIGGKIYVAGGRFGGGVGSEMTGILEVFDPKTGAWQTKAPMPTVRAGVNGIAVRGCLYVFGGEGNDAHPQGIFGEVEAYDPRSDTWTQLAPIPTPVHGVTGAVYFNNWVHLVGGGIARGGNSGSTLHQAFRPSMSCE